MSKKSNPKIIKEISTIDDKICRNINNLGILSRGEVSQDILASIRNLTDHVMLLIYDSTLKQNLDVTYKNITCGIKYCKSKGNFAFITRFHNMLQVSVSHYTLNEDNSERLLLKYYNHLEKIKDYLSLEYSLNILSNLEDFPINIEPEFEDYYRKIAWKVENTNQQNEFSTGKYYINKIKPFKIKNHIYYEISFSMATDYESKFNRIIAFTKLEISDFYSVELAFINDYIKIFGKVMPILIITDWKVSIRSCEYKNFSKLLNGSGHSPTKKEQEIVSSYLTSTKLNLAEVVALSEEDFVELKDYANKEDNKAVFFNELYFCKKMIDKNKPGSNVLKYLLLNMNNRIIKSQTYTESNYKLSGLFLKFGCIPFDEMPYATSLINHNPKLSDLVLCIDATNRKHELLARQITNNVEINRQLFTPLKELSDFDNIDELVKKYNDSLYTKHVDERELVINKDFIYINGYMKNTKEILDLINPLTNEGVTNYSNYVRNWLESKQYEIDCPEKSTALINLFDNSKLAFIYGAAGTGKSTFINHIVNLYKSIEILLLTQTNPALNNLKRKVLETPKTNFMTIAKFLSNKNEKTNYSILIIDESSTVSNRDMNKILEKAKYEALIFVGDPYQISSIRFGNWFALGKYKVDKNSIVELTIPYRSSNEDLKLLWDRVRNMDDKILELLTRQGYTNSLDESIFRKENDDEIILCLNYDGLYGINNINRYLQENNPEESVYWGVNKFKVNDPILFNENERFAPVIYNNMKGRIDRIKMVDKDLETERICFDIEIDTVIDEIIASTIGCELVEKPDCENSVIRFIVNKNNDFDADNYASIDSVIPFQIAYAVSIHKAQGLEYNSVKVVITKEVNEQIDHNIFYTAITRAKEHLMIYWSIETSVNIIDNLKPLNNRRDLYLLDKL